jgi:hypothetical protein
LTWSCPLLVAAWQNLPVGPVPFGKQPVAVRLPSSRLFFPLIHHQVCIFAFSFTLFHPSLDPSILALLLPLIPSSSIPLALPLCIFQNVVVTTSSKCKLLLISISDRMLIDLVAPSHDLCGPRSRLQISLRLIMGTQVLGREDQGPCHWY